MRGARPTGPAIIARIRATLRKAFDDALARKVVSGIPNPATLVKTSNARAKPIVWEPERAERWRATGEVPGPVMVWTDDLLVQFLDYAADHAPDLHRLLHFMAYRGPRRVVRPPRRRSPPRQGRGQHRQPDRHSRLRNPAGAAKSDAGNRDVIPDPDPDTVAVLTAYKARRAAWRLAAGTDWPDTRLFFVRPDGKPWHPDAVTQRFRRLVKRAGLPPSACTICATAPPPSPSTLASTSMSSTTNSATPSRHLPERRQAAAP